MHKFVAELNFEYEDGDFQIPLTDIQLQAIFKILGIKIDTKEQNSINLWRKYAHLIYERRILIKLIAL
ncbi:hypothetical protein ACT7C8_01115 [Bacillus cereus]|uniref:hypothetical protein n=1 Tax=unclassified Bacillus cereus group TaxID=2750818 RepID=UPI001F57F316